MSQFFSKQLDWYYFESMGEEKAIGGWWFSPMGDRPLHSPDPIPLTKARKAEIDAKCKRLCNVQLTLCNDALNNPSTDFDKCESVCATYRRCIRNCEKKAQAADYYAVIAAETAAAAKVAAETAAAKSASERK